MSSSATTAPVALVTIGQAPRDDIAAALRPALGSAQLVQAGALDELGHAEIAGLVPAAGEPPLVSKLRDGTEVVVGKRSLMPHLSAALARVSDGAAAVALLCSGSFPGLDASGVILPEAALRERLARELGRTDGGRLGVVAPLAAQADQAGGKWGDPATDVVAVAASPYGADDALREAVGELAERAPDLVLLDCMGFVERHRTLAAPLVAAPVLSACSVLADALVREANR